MIKNKRKGFTLIELIAVIAILVILGAILVPNVLGYRKKAQKSNIQASAKTLIKAIDTYNSDKNDLKDQIGDEVGSINYVTGIDNLNGAGIITSSNIPDELNGVGAVKNITQLNSVADGKFDVDSVSGKASKITLTDKPKQ